jgi:hypothetical protein
MKKSSQRSADLKLTLSRTAVKNIALPDGLFDGRVPVDKGAPGLFVPIIVFRNNGKFTILDGCKRWTILKERKKPSIACAVIETALNPLDAGLLRIELNSTRQLHPREKLLFLGWLRTNFRQKEFRKLGEKLIGNAGERHGYEQLLACRPWLVDAVMRGTLDAAVAPEMNHLPETDAGALVRLFSSLSFSRQMQRELAEWLPEIAFIRKIPLPELLGAGLFADILFDTRLNDPQKVAAIHGKAHDTRFPLYSETKKSWTKHARDINPDPSRVSFQPSPYFEKDTLEIKIKAEDAQGIQQIMRKLASVELHKWQELIDPSAGAVTSKSDIPQVNERRT